MALETVVSRQSGLLSLLLAGLAGLAGCAQGTAFDADLDAPLPPVHAPPPAQSTDASPEDAGTDEPTGPITEYPIGAIATLSGDATDADHTRIAIYGPRPTAKSKPIATLDAPSVPGQIASLAFDKKHQLYTLDYSGRVNVFASGASGSASPVRVIHPDGVYTNADVSYYEGIGVDSKGTIYLTINTQLDQIGPASIEAYAPDAQGDAKPERTIQGPHTELRMPLRLGFDQDDHLFVGDYMAFSVFVFATDADGDAAPMRTACVTEGLQAMAVAPNGTLYVAPEGEPGWSVRVYEPFNGTSQKLAGVIAGSATGLDPDDAAPIGLAVDPWGDVEVISPSYGLRFVSGILGNVAPAAHFSGSDAIAVVPRGSEE